MKIRVNIVFIIYAVMNLIICVKWGQLIGFTEKASRRFNWWINDIMFALIVLLFAYPYILNMEIEFSESITANWVFFFLIVANIAMVMTNYLYGDQYDEQLVLLKIMLAVYLIAFVPRGKNKE